MTRAEDCITCGHAFFESLFCEKCLQPLRAEQALTKEQEAAVFSNWEVIRGVNQQLLDALSAPAPEDPLVRAAAAFESMAPWLKSYSVYSANFVTAQEKLYSASCHDTRAQLLLAPLSYQPSAVEHKQTITGL